MRLYRWLLLSVLAILLAGAFSLSLAAPNQSLYPIMIGWQSQSVAGSTWAPQAQTLNAAAPWIAFSVRIPPGGKTINSFRIYCKLITGAVGASDVQATLYDAGASSTLGVPGSPIAANGPFNPVQAPANTTWLDYTGFSHAAPGSTMRWVVIKNVNGSPTTIFPNIGYGGQDSGGSRVNFCNGGTGFMLGITTNSGGSWTIKNACSGVRVGYSDGSYDGNPFADGATDGTNLIYGTREYGTQFQLPYQPTLMLNVRGLAYQGATNTGVPTGLRQLRLYTGAVGSMVLQGTTVALPYSGSLASTTCSEFASPVQIPGNSLATISMGDSAGNTDTSSNCFRTAYATWDTDTNSVGLMPYGSSTKAVYFNATSWSTLSSSNIPPFCMWLDTVNAAGPFTIKTRPPAPSGMLLDPDLTPKWRKERKGAA